MLLDKITLCPCYSPFDLYVQERECVIKSESPVIRSEFDTNVRLLCDNCGRSSPWCEDLDKAIKYWNESIQYEH